jgi:hypothetical protein
MINEIICDTILRKFEVNTSIAQENLRDASFYQNIDPDYRVVEDHINFLIADKTLRKIDRTVTLTTKGWFILTNYDKVGYVAQKIESVRRENAERESRLFFRWASIICAGLLAIYLILALSNQ